MVNNKGVGIIVIIVIVGLFFFLFQDDAGFIGSTACIQVATPACNPSTNQIQTFPTPCDVPDDWTTDLNQCSEQTSISREIVFSEAKTEITLFIEGSGKFGGILNENIPEGLDVIGITSSNLGISGSVTGKLTGNVYEIVYTVDNVEQARITYELSAPEEGVVYDFEGSFEFAEGFEGACLPLLPELEEACNVLGEADCNSAIESCSWVPSLFGEIGGDKQIFRCLIACARPINLCTPAFEVPDGCGDVCDGFWQVLKNSEADFNCDELVSNTELLDAITDWVSNLPPFDDNQILLSSITAWVSS